MKVNCYIITIENHGLLSRSPIRDKNGGDKFGGVKYLSYLCRIKKTG